MTTTQPKIKLYKNDNNGKPYYYQRVKHTQYYKPETLELQVLGMKKVEDTSEKKSYLVLCPKGTLMYQKDAGKKNDKNYPIYEDASIDEELIHVLIEYSKEYTPILFEHFTPLLDELLVQCTVWFQGTDDNLKPALNRPILLASQISANIDNLTNIPLISLEDFSIEKKQSFSGKGGYGQTELQKLKDRESYLLSLDDATVGMLFNSIGTLMNFPSVSEFLKWYCEMILE